MTSNSGIIDVTIMNVIGGRGSASGFALPTVLIASIVMLIVLLTGLSAVSSANTALRQQYYDRVTKEAVESGVTKTDACLAKSNQIVTWSDANPLMPNTDCNGVVITAAPAPSQYILDTPNLKTTFSVPAPIDQNGTMRVNVTAILYKYRTSGSGTPQTQTETRSSLVGGQNSFSNVAFGYLANDGAQFAVVLPTGDVKAVGANSNGRLGNGTTTNTLTPTLFGIPSSEKGVAAYTNFLSVGQQVFVQTQSGKVYGAGTNTNGQLGNGLTTNSPVSVPVQFGTLGNAGQPKAKFVGGLLDATFVLGDDNNIYSAGTNSWSLLGRTCASVCPTPGRVALPAVNLGDPNTLPVADPGWVQPTNMAVDRVTVYVRMQGGAVYGWGGNDVGELGNGTTTTPATPVKIGTFGDAGQPKAVQIGQDGMTLYLIDSNGDAWVTGYNNYGEFGGAATQMNLPSGYCMDVPGANFANGQRVGIYQCNRGVAQTYQWYPDGTIRVGGKCLDNANNTNANGNPIQLWDCNGFVQQQFKMGMAGNDTAIVNVATGRCVDNSGNNNVNGNLLILYDCNLGVAQQWSEAGGSLTLVKVPKPAGAGKFVRLTTDQFSVIYVDEFGKAWGAGLNDFGQLGIGGSSVIVSPSLKPVTAIPAGNKIVDAYNTKYGAASAGSANTYFILDDGSVYGTGSNESGQLGVGSVFAYSTAPMKMNLPAGVLARTVQSGFSTTVVITTSGKIYTVGNNSNGQLGDGTTTSSSTPKANQYTNQRTTIRY